jgi:Brp/Blh family beta-carotene 15,15'-monooxygenase
MTSRYPKLYRSLQASSLVFILLGVFLPQLLSQVQLVVAVVLILLIGIPHGATDYLIFKYLSRPWWGSRRLHQFYFKYLLLMLGYGLLWYLLPMWSLMIFLVISAYHFGQSNWNYLSLKRKSESALLYLLWGSFVVFTPILWHYEESSVIIATIIGGPAPAIAKSWLEAFCIALFVFNIWTSIYYFFQQKIQLRELRDELLNLFLLGLLFISTPVLLGFAIYFVGWHSMSSVLDQVRFFNRKNRAYSWRRYFKNAIPLTLAAIAGIGLMGATQWYMGLPVHIGLLFVFVSIITLPHMLLIDQLYQELPSTSVSEQQQSKEEYLND